MNKIKGIIVDQDKEDVVILTPDGRFIKGEAQGREIGSETHVSPVGTNSRLKLSAARKPAALAVLLAAVMLIFLSALFLPFREPALAFIQLEVNPAVEIGIDSDGKVRELTPLNDDGSVLIRKFGDWDGKDVTVLLGRIFTEYGEDDRELTVTSVEASDEKLADVIDRTVHFIENAAGEEGMLLSVSEADGDLRDRAWNEGVPISSLQKKNEETQKTAPAENIGHEEADVKPDRPDAAAKETVPAPREKAEVNPDPSVLPKGDEQSKPAGDLQENGGHGGKPEESAKPAQASPKKEPSEKRDNQGNPPAHSGQDKKTPPPGHAGQDKKTTPPGHAGQKKPSGPPPHANPQNKVRPGENSDGDRVSPGQAKSSNNGQQNKNSGNGNGGNGNGRGN
ncbi:hypothetical protein AV656_05200 [Bhargavaea cecembensis]|uniref:RsgI N-terminal anti-sigma domain-containing protein n=1 Tax=Bhargavaea cecembensis TaxID=394098 RepID=A0A165GZS1_9BACL|nr:hypothetical protein [Bhargavaea cecembensis]KZE38315.1 hypothetical protein AV656_05200 [Bhargavaea cecembensis]